MKVNLGHRWKRSGDSVLNPRYSLLFRSVIHVTILAAGSLAVAQEAVPTAPPPVKATTQVEPKSVHIGTPFRYTMRVETIGDVEIIVPILAEKLGDFFIRDFGESPVRKGDGHAVLEHWYTLATYEPGDQIVPGPPIQYRVAGSDLQTLAAPDALVIVESLLPESNDALPVGDIRDIKGPVSVPPDYRPLWWGLSGLLLLLALAAGLYWFLNSRPAAVVAPPRPAQEIALEALRHLRAARLPEAGRYADYYIRITAIVRTYIEERFGLRVPEMTTEEFLQVAQRDQRLAPDHRASLAQFLGDADLVKFARHVPTIEDATRAYEAARGLIESTGSEPEVARAAA